jgi:2-polyprenyl-3-methyl-5-hydroxy-6-metoxy-1,4-benzoquinol methylase
VSGFFFPDLRDRSDEKELMDTEDADLALLRTTVRQFRIFNMLLSASRNLVRRHFFSVMERAPGSSYSLLDMGTGGCDIPVWIVREARRRGLRVSVTALDYDARIVPVALDAARGYPEIRVVTGNALEVERLGEFDFVFSNHFLHHLSWDEIEVVMRYVVRRARRAFLMNDLERSAWAYAGYTIFAGLFIRKSLAFYDGRLSIRRGFLAAELEEFLGKRFAGSNIRIGRTGPSRVYLFGSRG